MGNKGRGIIFQKIVVSCSLKQKELGYELGTINEVRCSLDTGVASRATKHKAFFLCKSERLALKPYKFDQGAVYFNHILISLTTLLQEGGKAVNIKNYSFKVPSNPRK